VERARGVDHVLLGEASHGTHEYYRWRAELTRRLIEDGGVRFVAVEGDWPDCHRLHRCVTLQPGAPEDPREVLDGFRRWPTWMWANEEVVEFCRWLRDWNAQRPSQQRVGFHGLDVYSLWDSLRAVMDYLHENEPEHLDTAHRAWTCFEPYREDPQSYARSLRLVPESCEHDVAALLRRLCEQRPEPDGADAESRFVAEQNAAVAAGAERYYRALVTGGSSSWNVRDCHMTDTLDRLVEHYGPGRSVVWEHNTHVGDARATDMSRYGDVNVGQLVRERHGRQRVLTVGFAGHRGTVVAADRWDAPTRVLPLPPAREGSLEDLLVAALPEPALLAFPAQDDQPPWLRERRGHRAVGVVYDPDRERWGNYVPTVLGDRYDALLWFPETRALRPLHVEPRSGEAETWPTGQ
jgi:erythromycin esterase